MSDALLHSRTVLDFIARHGRAPEAAAFAPGRIEVLGNHTDYNEGFVLSAAIQAGCCVAAGARPDRTLTLAAPDLDASVSLDLDSLRPLEQATWANYVLGVLAGLRAAGSVERGADIVLRGNVPLGAGLSSSAALEMAAGLALAHLYGLTVPPLELARIGQLAEHTYAGTRCGLLDQVTSLFAQPAALVLTDFRSLAIRTVPLPADACFLMCNTGVKHALVDGQYNERRAACERAVSGLNGVLEHPVHALRDVTEAELAAYRARLDDKAARRAAHVVGENARVQGGVDRLAAGDLAGFGRLMFASHESSRHQFENSCAELDLLVEAARATPGALGARLSGGGFGGSVVVLTHTADADTVGQRLAAVYAERTGSACDVRRVVPGAGAGLLDPPGPDAPAPA